MSSEVTAAETFVNHRDPARQLGADGKPLVSRRAPLWADVPDEKWNDWRWQLSHRVNELAEVEQVLNLTDEERDGLSAPDKFRVDITPYFLSLIDPDDPNDPIRRQVIPLGREQEAFTAMMEDSLAEDRHSPVPGLVHRYPDRVLMLVTTQCASYCRYCTRSRIVGDPTQNFNRAEHEAQLDYLRRTPQVRDVLISGGDGLTLAPKLLESILRGLREIPHIEIIRIGSRVPVFLPQRVDDELCAMLERYHPIWMNLHFNHSNEITPEVARAVDKLTRVGIPVGNQSVLLAGVNDCVNIQRDLVHRLVEMRVRPYYIYQCDLVEGSGHFRTPVGKGLEIMEGLRGHTSGYAIPTYVIDAPGGGGKIPVMPNYLISYSDHKVVLRNYEGYITTYEEPLTYEQHDKATCKACQTARQEPGQSGVYGLLQGERMWIEPTDFAQVHSRGNLEPHRLQRPEKWTPYGVGPIEGQASRPNCRSCRRLRAMARTAMARTATARQMSTRRARSHGRATASRPAQPTGNCSSPGRTGGCDGAPSRGATVHRDTPDSAGGCNFRTARRYLPAPPLAPSSLKRSISTEPQADAVVDQLTKGGGSMLIRAMHNSGGFRRSLLLTLVAMVAVLLVAGSALAHHKPGHTGGPSGPHDNRGTVKIHEGAGEPSPLKSSQPQVCELHVHMFKFHANQELAISIVGHGGNAGPDTYQSTAVTDANGEARDPATGSITLADGTYKLTVDTGKGAGKHKVFKVDCPDTETPPGLTPGGGSGAGPGRSSRRFRRRGSR